MCINTNVAIVFHRVWDNFVLDGTSFLYRVAIAILKLFTPILCPKHTNILSASPASTLLSTITIDLTLEEVLPLLLARDDKRYIWDILITEESLFRVVTGVKLSNKVKEALRVLTHSKKL